MFKLKQARLGKDGTVQIAKRHMFKGDATTFRLYPGAHRVRIQVNGRVIGGAEFDLTGA